MSFPIQALEAAAVTAINATNPDTYLETVRKPVITLTSDYLQAQFKLFRVTLTWCLLQVVVEVEDERATSVAKRAISPVTAPIPTVRSPMSLSDIILKD